MRSSEFWCAEHISTGRMGQSTRIFGFSWVLWGFRGIVPKWCCREYLLLGPTETSTTAGSSVYTNDAPVTPARVTKLLDTIRKYLNVRASPSESAREEDHARVTTGWVRPQP